MQEVPHTTLDILAILGGVVGVEGQLVPGFDREGLLGLVSSSGASEART